MLPRVSENLSMPAWIVNELPIHQGLHIVCVIWMINTVTNDVILITIFKYVEAGKQSKMAGKQF